MTLNEAKRILNAFESDTDTLSDEDFFLYTEAMDFVIQSTGSPRYMLELGGAYYSRKEYGLALKYYEMSAEMGYEPAIVGLGYIWYYGRTGTVDYQKAFRCFSSAPDNIIARYKVADMYKNGYFVEQDFEKYRRIIEELYQRVCDWDDPFAPLPEIFTRYAEILRKDGKTEEALALYLTAKKLLALRLESNPFFGNLSIMKYLVRDIHSLSKPQPDKTDLYDMFELLRKPASVSFMYGGKKHHIESLAEDGRIVIRYDGKWYAGIDDFFAKATAEGERLTAIAALTENLEVN